MKVKETRDQLIRNMYIEQLNKLNYHDMHDKTTKELKFKLAVLREIRDEYQVRTV